MSRLRLSWDWLTDYRVRLRFRCGSADFAEPSIIDIRVYITLDGSFWRRGVPEKRRGRLGTDAISRSRAYRVKIGNQRDTDLTTGSAPVAALAMSRPPPFPGAGFREDSGCKARGECRTQVLLCRRGDGSARYPAPPETVRLPG